MSSWTGRHHTTVAGRLAGAFRNIGRDKIADNIFNTMNSAGHNIVETDPFEEASVLSFKPKRNITLCNPIKNDVGIFSATYY